MTLFCRFVLLSIVALPETVAAKGESLPTIDAEVGEQNVPEASDEVIVVTGTGTSGTVTDAPVAVDVISGKDLRDAGQSVAEVLERYAGADVSRSFRGAGVRLQGLEPKQVLILVDGVRVPGRVDGVVDLSRFSVHNIERIEIAKGPGSALYGSDAMAGVINIITRRPQEPLEAEVTASAGSLGTANLSGSVGLRRTHWSTHFASGWDRRDGFDLDPATIATSGSAFSKVHLTNRSGYQVNDKLSFAGKVHLARQRMHGIDDGAARATFDRKNLTEEVSASLGTTLHPSEASVLRTRVHAGWFRDQFLLDQRNASALDRFEETREGLVGASTQLEYLLTPRHLASVGIDGLYEHLRSPRLKERVGQRSRASVFVQDEWLVYQEPSLVFVPGARFDFDSQFGSTISPKLAARWDPTPNHTLRASYGFGYRAPTFKELLLRFENPSAGYVVEGNTDLRPEVSRGLLITGDYRQTDTFTVSVQLFHNRIQDLILPQTMPSEDNNAPLRFAYDNIASARTQGVEASLRLEPVAGLHLQASYALTHAVDQELNIGLTGRPLHRGTCGARFESESVGFEVGANASVVGRRPFYAQTDSGLMTQWAAPYATVDTLIRQKVAGDVNLSAGVTNLLNTGNAATLPIPPRIFFLRASRHL